MKHFLPHRLADYIILHLALHCFLKDGIRCTRRRKECEFVVKTVTAPFGETVTVFVMPGLLTCNPDHQGWSILHTSFLRLPVSDYMHCCLNQISVHSLYLVGAGLR